MSHRQLDLAQREVTGTRTTEDTPHNQTHRQTDTRTEHTQFDQVYLLVQLLEAELQLLSSVGVGDVRGDAGRRLFVPRQVLLGA